MSAFQVVQISPTVRKVLDAPGEGWCATFEVVGVDNAWAQVTKGTLNLAYPFPNAPNVADVVAHLPGAALTSWEANTFVTFAFESGNADAIARAIDHLFTKFLQRPEYSVDSRIENLDA
jgi:hypothetical protein